MVAQKCIVPNRYLVETISQGLEGVSINLCMQTTPPPGIMSGDVFARFLPAIPSIFTSIQLAETFSEGRAEEFALRKTHSGKSTLSDLPEFSSVFPLR